MGSKLPTTQVGNLRGPSVPSFINHALESVEAQDESLLSSSEPGSSSNKDRSSHNNPKADNFIGAGDTCRGLGTSCLAGYTCCSGKCEEPPGAERVSVCVPQSDEAYDDTKFEVNNFLDSRGSCRGRGRSCFVNSNCCSNRCQQEIITRICVP